MTEMRWILIVPLCAIAPVTAQEPVGGPAINFELGSARGVGITFPVGIGIRVNPRIRFDRSDRDGDLADGTIRRDFSVTYLGADLRLLVDVGEGPVQWYWGVGGGVRLAIIRERYTGDDLVGPLPAGLNESRLGASLVASWGARVAIVERVSALGEVNLSYRADDSGDGTSTNVGIGTTAIGFLIYF